jgi:release factor glutamine methyltransferase
MPDIADPDEPDQYFSWWGLWMEMGRVLEEAGISNGLQEARWLVEEVSGLGSPISFDGFSERAPMRRVDNLEALVERRAAGEPIQYVLGHWPFRELDLTVDPRVLIPRPETEAVCQYALFELDRLGELAGRAEGPLRVVDLGTGSGAIALSVAYENANTQVWATERSPGAAEVARANLAALGRLAQRVQIVEGSWFEPLPDELRGTIDLVVSNPPYIGAADEVEDIVRKWEPLEALYPVPEGATGLEAIEAILREARQWLAPHGSVLLEIGESQRRAAGDLAVGAGYPHVTVWPDYADRTRALLARQSRG